MLLTEEARSAQTLSHAMHRSFDPYGKALGMIDAFRLCST